MTSGHIRQRTIVHLDMDAFFASVELRRHPELVGRPVAVGGTGRRGVIAAASYEARRFGVRSAMPTSTALRACPHLVLLNGDHPHYSAVSAEVFEILREVTPLVESLSLDEAFLDVSGSLRLFGHGRQIAESLRATIRQRLALSCSVGVAPSKFLAKLASEAAKPVSTATGVVPGPGVVVIEPGHELEFLHPLPVEALWGVGPATLAKLTALGVRRVGQLAALDRAVVVGALGPAVGEHLHRLSWADDDRAVEPDRNAKSIGHEETFPYDLFGAGELHTQLVRLADGVGARLRAGGLAARTVHVKVRFGGFTTITRSTTLARPIATAHDIVAAAAPLLAAIDVSPGVRLLGVSTSNFADASAAAEQLSFDLLAGDTTDTSESWKDAEHTIDQIRRRFGDRAIATAGAIGPRGVRVVVRGAQQWGPDRPS